MRHYEITVGEGRSLIELRATSTGRGISILLTGGDSPHVGAVAVCRPTTDQAAGSLSEHTWLAPMPGHKDIDVAKPLAEMVSTHSGQVTVVTAGIHIDQALTHEIKLLLRNCNLAGEQFCKQLQHDSE